MKRVICIFIAVSMLLFLSACTSDKVAQAEETYIEQTGTSSLDESAATVFVTPAGKRYHKPNCRHVKDNDNLSKIELIKAERKGYTPCKTCYK